MTTQAAFAAGRNIAIKVPPHLCESTIYFFRSVGVDEPEPCLVAERGGILIGVSAGA